MFARRTLTSLMALAVVALPLTLAACGDFPVDTTASVPAGSTQHVISVNLASVDKVIHAFGVDGAKVAGANHLTGDGTDSDGSKVQVEFLALVDYVKGSGSFDGIATFTFADSSTITARTNPGVTVATASATSFDSPIVVLGGTGAFLNVAGSGRFTGTRTTELGGAVQSQYTLSITTT